MRRLRRKIEDFAGPPWSRRARVLLALVVALAGYACYRWRLMHARNFALLGFTFAVVLLLIRRALWKASDRH
jgi:hypothetical protein